MRGLWSQNGPTDLRLPKADHISSDRQQGLHAQDAEKRPRNAWGEAY